MALNSADKKLIDEVASNLRTRFEHQVPRDGVQKEEIDGVTYNIRSNEASTPVAISKEELRENSRRRIARDSYLTEVASALSQKSGIVARADLDQGVVYAHAVADTEYLNRPMSIKDLKVQADVASKRLAEENEEN